MRQPRRQMTELGFHHSQVTRVTQSWSPGPDVGPGGCGEGAIPVREAWSRLESAAKTCLGTSLATLAVVAVLANAMFYSMLAADYSPVARLLGPAIIVGAMLMATTLLLGLVLHGLAVVKRRSQAISTTMVVHVQPHVGRAG